MSQVRDASARTTVYVLPRRAWLRSRIFRPPRWLDPLVEADGADELERGVLAAEWLHVVPPSTGRVLLSLSRPRADGSLVVVGTLSRTSRCSAAIAARQSAPTLSSDPTLSSITVPLDRGFEPTATLREEPFGSLPPAG
jgi:hypothetical protein